MTSPVAAADAHCAALAATHYENFPVVGWFTPRALRPHLRALYAYCRTVDDLGDEAAGDRGALLDRWERDLDACYAGEPRGPVFTALSGTIRRFAIPPDPFRRLIRANRTDQARTRHETYADLLAYCDDSANPVGRLVLHVLERHDERRGALSDATCTALQLTNFWQDVARDREKGRVYIPQEDLRRFGVDEDAIARREATPAFRRCLAFQVERTRALFRTGLALVGEVPESFRTDLLLFTRGGWGILDRIRDAGYDTLTARPAWSRWDKIKLVLGTRLARGRLMARGLGA